MCKSAKYAVLLGLILSAILVAGCSDETGIKWHSYIHSPSGQIHYNLHLASYKRGIFFGSCGPSTRSLQWEYYIELAGIGPNYTKEAISIKDGNFQQLRVASGSILLDQNKNAANVNITVLQNSKSQQFEHNGTYKMQKEH